VSTSRRLLEFPYAGWIFFPVIEIIQQKVIILA
jgi:hypothetical protein